MPHVLHHARGGPLHAALVESDFQSAQIRECYHAGKKVAADLAVGPVSDRAGANQVIIFAETKPVFNLPSIKAGLHDFMGRPIRVIGDDNIFAEHCLLFTDPVDILSKTHRQTVLGLLKTDLTAIFAQAFET